MSTVIFATNDPKEARARMVAANGRLSDGTLDRIEALVVAGAIRVGDNAYHAPGSLFMARKLTEVELAEIGAIDEQARIETLSEGGS